MKSQIANSKLSDKGELSYNWAYNHMPALSRIIEKTKEEQPLSNRKIGVCLHITKETSALIIGLKLLELKYIYVERIRYQHKMILQHI